ncbi:hypothetical protein LPJ61_000469 [Coemansia biformis]|uniref:C3H1-type domain-containing protein n=1 Tax=Coemansia biformis TaxID=1286918 RepID=A0A9W7YHU3_9FUNG|nr:hypothetical protein LPJ61_000469 [Coemansia biformis]
MDACSDSRPVAIPACLPRLRRRCPAAATQGPIATRSYKTALCKSFAAHGDCRYGSGCRFAHGPSELRQRPNPPKYKTVPCRNEAQGRICPYGAKCDYIHMDDPPGQHASPAGIPSTTRSLGMAPLSAPAALSSVLAAPPNQPAPGLVDVRSAAGPFADCGLCTPGNMFAPTQMASASLFDSYSCIKPSIRLPEAPTWPDFDLDLGLDLDLDTSLDMGLDLDLGASRALRVPRGRELAIGRTCTYLITRKCHPPF